jgi:hypothetical protein
MFSGFQLVFSYELLTWQLLSDVEFRVIAGAGLPHFPQDF